MITKSVSAPSVGLTTPVSQAASLGASWQGYLAPAGVLGFSGANCDGHVALHAVAGVVAVAAPTVPFATVPFAASTLAATVTVAAVAGAQQAAIAPKQAEKPNDMRNDAFPLGIRPGAPPS
jgi:hypothetical protein